MALNGHQCCALDLPCCIPPPGVNPADAQAVTIAKVIQKTCQELSDSEALKLSRALLENFDLVPPGVGKAIVAGYAKWMTGLNVATSGAATSRVSIGDTLDEPMYGEV